MTYVLAKIRDTQVYHVYKHADHQAAQAMYAVLLRNVERYSEVEIIKIDTSVIGR